MSISKQTDNHGTQVEGGLAPGNSVIAIPHILNPTTDNATGAVYGQQGMILVDKGGANLAAVDAQGAVLVTTGGSKAVSVASATPGAVKASAGRLCKVIITTLGTGSQVFYDNASAASGTILFATAASAPVGTIYDVQAPAVNGIYAAGAASTPVCTVLYN